MPFLASESTSYGFTILPPRHLPHYTPRPRAIRLPPHLLSLSPGPQPQKSLGLRVVGPSAERPTPNRGYSCLKRHRTYKKGKRKGMEMRVAWIDQYHEGFKIAEVRWIEKGEGEEYEVEPAMMGMGEGWSRLRVIWEGEGREVFGGVLWREVRWRGWEEVALEEEGKAEGEQEMGMGMGMEEWERVHEWMLYLASVERELAEAEEERVEEWKMGECRRGVERAKVVGRELKEGRRKSGKEMESGLQRRPAFLPRPWLQDSHGYYYINGGASTSDGKSWWYEVNTAMEEDLDMLLEEDMNGWQLIAWEKKVAERKKQEEIVEFYRRHAEKEEDLVESLLDPAEKLRRARGGKRKVENCEYHPAEVREASEVDMAEVARWMDEKAVAKESPYIEINELPRWAADTVIKETQKEEIPETYLTEEKMEMAIKLSLRDPAALLSEEGDVGKPEMYSGCLVTEVKISSEDEDEDEELPNWQKAIPSDYSYEDQILDAIQLSLQGQTVAAETATEGMWEEEHFEYRTAEVKKSSFMEKEELLRWTGGCAREDDRRWEISDLDREMELTIEQSRREDEVAGRKAEEGKKILDFYESHTAEVKKSSFSFTSFIEVERWTEESGWEEDGSEEISQIEKDDIQLAVEMSLRDQEIAARKAEQREKEKEMATRTDDSGIMKAWMGGTTKYHESRMRDLKYAREVYRWRQYQERRRMLDEMAEHEMRREREEKRLRDIAQKTFQKNEEESERRWWVKTFEELKEDKDAEKLDEIRWCTI